MYYAKSETYFVTVSPYVIISIPNRKTHEITNIQSYDEEVSEKLKKTIFKDVKGSSCFMGVNYDIYNCKTVANIVVMELRNNIPTVIHQLEGSEANELAELMRISYKGEK